MVTQIIFSVMLDYDIHLDTGQVINIPVPKGHQFLNCMFPCFQTRKLAKYLISSNNSQGWLFQSIFAPKGGDSSRELIISNISHRRWCPIYHCFIPSNKGKSKIHEHYRRKNFKKTTAFRSQWKFVCFPRYF